MRPWSGRVPISHRGPSCSASAGWAVYQDRLEIGGVVAFISGIGRITDPWGDLVNYFRDVNITQVKYALVRDAVDQQGQDQQPCMT